MAPRIAKAAGRKAAAKPTTTTPQTPAPSQSPAPPGHNGLSEQEREALLLSHLQTFRNALAAIELAMEPVRAAKKVFRKQREEARMDGFPLAILDEILKKESLTQKDLQQEAELSRWMHQIAGLPVGGQLEMFANTPVEVKDALDWEAEGYRAGIRGLEPVPPKECHPRHHQDWLKGYASGQERNAWALSERGRIVDRNPNIGVGGAAQLEPEPTDQTDIEDPREAAEAVDLESVFTPSEDGDGEEDAEREGDALTQDELDEIAAESAAQDDREPLAEAAQ